MFQWLKTKQSMVIEIKSLRSRMSIAEAQVQTLRRKLDRTNTELAFFRKVRKDTPPLPVKKVRDFPIETVDHLPASTYGSSQESSPKTDQRNEHGFPYGALVSKE